MTDISVEFDEESGEYLVINNDRESWLASFRYRADADKYADEKSLEVR